AEACQLDPELLHQSIEDGLEVAPRVEGARVVAADLLDGAGEDPRDLHTAQRTRVQEDSVGEPGGDQSLEIVVDGVAELRESTPVLERHVGAIGGGRRGNR